MLNIGPEICDTEEDLDPSLFAKRERRARFSVRGEAGPSILVVDDQRIIADTTSEILSRSGFRAVTAYDGMTALRLFSEMRPDFLLTDVMMPSMNGIELAIAVRKMQPETTILIFSGQAVTRDMLEEARSEGYCFDLVLKPIHPEELIAQLKRIGAK